MGIKHYNCDGYFSTMPNAMFEKIMEDDFYEMPASRRSRRLLEDDAFEEIKKKAYEQVEKIKKFYVEKYKGMNTYFESESIEHLKGDLEINRKYEKPLVWTYMIQVLLCNKVLTQLKNPDNNDLANKIIEVVKNDFAYIAKSQNSEVEAKEVWDRINLPNLLGIK